ncbi:MAG: DNA primase [Saprospiraceae bacterium]|nr:DNA primase [Saprospiraceae bacterium]
MISQQTIDKIRDAAKVEEVVGEFVSLKRRGSNLIGLCPFHNEKTPSFTVSPSKNFYKCFGCGEAGDSIKFLMEHEHQTYPDSLRYLAAKYGIDIEEAEWSPEEQLVRQHRDSLYVINAYAQTYFQEQLFESDLGKSIGLSYFKDRGYREETIRRFHLGYAPDQKRAFTDAAISDSFDPELLKELGLTTAKDFDFFRGRVIFPIHNLSGKPIAFAGRILGKSDRAPKYLNSPESEVYHKSKVLYGIHQASKSIRSLDSCILVEGYTDVLSLAQEGIAHSVASSGTALTIDQVRLIKRFSQNLVILYDGDAAGLKAATRGLDIALEQDMNVRVVLLPDGEDPDSLVRKLGGEKMLAFMEEHGEDVILFKTKRLLAEVGNDPIRKTGLTRDVVGSIALIPDAIKRSLYIKECARVLDLEESMLISEMNGVIRQSLHHKNRAEGKSSPPAPANSISGQTREPQLVPEIPPVGSDSFNERKIVQLLIAFGDKQFEEGLSVAEYIVGEIEDVISEFDDPLYRKLVEEVHGMVSRKAIVSENYFLKHPEPAVRQLAYDLLQPPWELSAGWSEKWEIELGTQKHPQENFVHDSVESVLRLKIRKVQRLRNQNQEKLKACDPADLDRQMQLLRVAQRLAEIHNEIAYTLRMVVPK